MVMAALWVMMFGPTFWGCIDNSMPIPVYGCWPVSHVLMAAMLVMTFGPTFWGCIDTSKPIAVYGCWPFRLH